MFSKLSGFVRQHKKKILFGGGFIAGAYLLNHFLRRKLDEWHNQQTQSYLDHLKHQHHFEGILQTSDSTILSLLPKIREPLLQILETESLLEKLKARPHNRLEIWEEMKARILAFAVCSVYAESLLATLLRVQLGVIGGYVYVNTQRQAQDTGGALPALTNQETHQLYLSLVQYFFDSGIEELVRVVKVAVVTAFGHVSLKERVSTNDFAIAFDYIKEHLARDGNPLPGFVSFLLPPPNAEHEAEVSPVLRSMVLETRDILETEDFSKVLSACIDMGFSSLRSEVETSIRIMQDAESERPSTSFPLARLLPVLKSCIVAGRRDTFVKEVLQSDLLHSMLANVYEAFCQTENVDRVNHNLAPFS
ncbi:peroxisomal biogenesis factor 3-like [Ornithodoros turicata]|uniref:peroxisomal biogenesis factor 3-like n=1 Tax=Ornithodoros turicata TaxID=34597 RepID=UPI0031398275